MKTNWQDPGSDEIRSTHVSGLQEAVGKIEDILGIQTTAATGIPLSEVYVSADDRYRIYQAPAGQRNWLASPAPVIKKNGVVITTGFEIDYGGGAIILSPSAIATDVFAADATYITNQSSHTADPAQTPTGNGPGTLTQWFSWLANRIKAITGTTNWWDAPAATLAAIWAKFNSVTGHKHTGAADDAPQITATGIADNAVTTAKLAAGAAVANIGYTPVNKAGDRMSGTLEFTDADRRVKTPGPFISVESATGLAVLSAAISSYMASNCYHDGTNWMRYNTANPAYLLVVNNAGKIYHYSVAAGANPITWGTPVEFVNKAGDTMTGNLRLPSIELPPSTGITDLDTFTGKLRVVNVSNTIANRPSDWAYVVNIPGDDGQRDMQMAWFYGASTGLWIRTKWDTGTWNAWQKVWHSGNDGAGTGLDADMVDGKHAADIAVIAATYVDTTTTVAAGGTFTVNLPIGSGRKLAYFSAKNPTLSQCSAGGFITDVSGDNFLYHQNGSNVAWTDPDVTGNLNAGSFSESVTAYVVLQSATIVGSNLALVFNNTDTVQHTLKVDIWTRAW